MKFISHPIIVATLSLAIIGLAAAVPVELIDGLGDENYQLREKSEQGLKLWAKNKGEQGLDELSELKKKSKSPEVKSRLENVMSGITVYKAIPGTQGFMGISMQAAMGGCVILGVSPDTPADKSGLQPNDKIIELDGIDLTKKNEDVDEATDFLRTYVKRKKSGEKLTIKINRDGKILTKTLKLADYDKQMARLEGEIDPFGGFGNGRRQVLPMQGGGFGRRPNIVPRAKNRDVDPRQLLQRNQNKLKQLLENPDVPDEFKKMLRLEDAKLQKQLNQLKEELKLKEKKVPEK
jgi:membrane-associated protease RseP (regulator of RpoE activity)